MGTEPAETEAAPAVGYCRAQLETIPGSVDPSAEEPADHPLEQVVRVEEPGGAHPLEATSIVEQLIDRVRVERLALVDRIDPKVPPDPAQGPTNSVVESRLRRIQPGVRSTQLRALIWPRSSAFSRRRPGWSSK